MSVSPSVVSGPCAGDVPPSVSPEAPPPLVLLIEDEEMVADLVERLLVRLGKRVLRARDGAEGAQMFAEYEHDIALVMLDCCLPDIDGVAMCRVIRQHAPNLPFGSESDNNISIPCCGRS